MTEDQIDDSPRPPIRIILDVSAVAGYGVNLSVGALLSEFTEDEPGAVFAVSTGTLAQAYASGVDATSLGLLMRHPSCVIISPFTDWGPFGQYLRDFPNENVHDAYLTYMAFTYGAYIFTGTPDTYLKSDPEAPTLLLEDPFEDDQ